MAYTSTQFNDGAKPAPSTEMFSFTFNPELVNLFWGLYKGRSDSNSSGGATIEDGPPVESATIPFFIEPIATVPSANVQQSQYFIFGYQLPLDADASLTKNVLNVLRHSVITTGIVILVGLGSYCTYYTLQKLRRLFTKESSTALKCQNNDDSKSSTIIPNSTASVSQKTDSGHGSSNDLEVVKLGLTLELKNGKSEVFPDQANKQVHDGKRRKGRRRHEGEHFSPNPVLSNINRVKAFTSRKDVPKEGRVLVGGGEEYTFRGDDDEFQIEYFGPERSSSSSTLSDGEDDIYPDPYKNRSGGGQGGIMLPGTTIQAMISPSHNQAATVRRQLDFGDVSPIPSAAPAVPYHQHHHLPPLSASSSMSLSPSTPTTEDMLSPTVTSSTPQPPTG